MVVIAEEEEKEEKPVINSLKEAPKELEDEKSQNTINELKEINLGSEDKPRPTFISIFQGGAYQLVDHLGERVMPPINGRYLKKYFI